MRWCSRGGRFRVCGVVQVSGKQVAELEVAGYSIDSFWPCYKLWVDSQVPRGSSICQNGWMGFKLLTYR